MVAHVTCGLLEQDQSFFAVLEIVRNHSHSLLLKGLLSYLNSGLLKIHLDTVVNKGNCVNNDVCQKTERPQNCKDNPKHELISARNSIAL